LGGHPCNIEVDLLAAKLSLSYKLAEIVSRVSGNLGRIFQRNEFVVLSHILENLGGPDLFFSSSRPSRFLTDNYKMLYGTTNSPCGQVLISGIATSGGRCLRLLAQRSLSRRRAARDPRMATIPLAGGGHARKHRLRAQKSRASSVLAVY